jgi:hypothetical protein
LSWQGEGVLVLDQQRLAAKVEQMFTRLDVTRLFIKLFGLLILLRVAIDLPSTVYQYVIQTNNWDTARVAYTWPTAVMLGASYLGPIAAYVAVGLGFLWCSGRIVDRAGQAPKDADLPVTSTDLNNIELSLVTVIGLYFLADGFAELCRLSFSQSLYSGLTGPPTPESLWTRMARWGVWLDMPWIVQALVKLTIGALLVLGRGTMVATLHQARHWVRKWRAWPYETE